MPTRFAIVAMLGFCVILACALVALTNQHPRRRRTILALAGIGLAIELLPIPRTLYSASVPRIYDVIAADPRPIRVLELPYGVRDGLSSLGDFNASSQFHQTYHRKSIAGGYLSRVSAQRKASYRHLAVRSALITLSERQPLQPEQERRARAAAGSFLSLTRHRLRRHGHGSHAAGAACVCRRSAGADPDRAGRRLRAVRAARNDSK